MRIFKLDVRDFDMDSDEEFIFFKKASDAEKYKKVLYEKELSYRSDDYYYKDSNYTFEDFLADYDLEVEEVNVMTKVHTGNRVILQMRNNAKSNR